MYVRSKIQMTKGKKNRRNASDHRENGIKKKKKKITKLDESFPEYHSCAVCGV